MIMLELFSSPSQVSNAHDEPGFKTYKSTLADGSQLEITFSKAFLYGDNDNAWELDFTRRRAGDSFSQASNKKTGDRGEIEVMSTVMNVAMQFLKTVEPNVLQFSAAKPPEDPRASSRSNLYRRMANRMAGGMYDIEESEEADFVFFVLTKKGFKATKHSGWAG